MFFAQVMRGYDAEDLVSDSWDELFAQIADGSVTSELRVALFNQVMARLNPAEPTAQQISQPPEHTFFGAGDRWEGWWDRAPAPWPDGKRPERKQVLNALSRLSVQQRAALVLRDVAGLQASQVMEVLTPVGEVDILLDSAREAYVVELDREISGS